MDWWYYAISISKRIWNTFANRPINYRRIVRYFVPYLSMCLITNAKIETMDELVSYNAMAVICGLYHVNAWSWHTSIWQARIVLAADVVEGVLPFTCTCECHPYHILLSQVKKQSNILNTHTDSYMNMDDLINVVIVRTACNTSLNRMEFPCY